MKKKVALLGSLFGSVYIIISTIGAIFIRKLFIQTFGTEYLGLTAIFSSIFGILAALDCGISSNIFLKIYEPLAFNNREKVKSVFSLIKLVYFIRGIVVMGVGSVVYLFLPIIAQKSNFEITFIQNAYILYLLFSVGSYFFIFYSFFMEAIQKKYLVSIISLLSYFFLMISQILVIKYFPNYLIYLIVSLSQGLLVYIICRILTYRIYPYLKQKTKIGLAEKSDLKSLLGMAFHSMGSVLASYTDAFLITGFTGITTLGLYDNYKIISDKVFVLLNQITSSIKDPMRVLMAEGDRIYAEKMLNNITFFIFWISGLAAVCLINMINPFIKLWLGSNYLLGNTIIIISALIVFLSTVSYIMIDSYYFTECYKNDKKAPIIEIIVNMLVSLVLGHYLGITGVLIGTVVYYFVQIFFRCNRLYTFYFKMSMEKYVKNFLLYVCFVIVAFIASSYACEVFFCSNSFTELLSNAVLSIIIYNGLFGAIFAGNEYYAYFKTLLIQFLCRKNEI